MMNSSEYGRVISSWPGDKSGSLGMGNWPRTNPRWSSYWVRWSSKRLPTKTCLVGSWSMTQPFCLDPDQTTLPFSGISAQNYADSDRVSHISGIASSKWIQMVLACIGKDIAILPRTVLWVLDKTLDMFMKFMSLVSTELPDQIWFKPIDST